MRQLENNKKQASVSASMRSNKAFEDFLIQSNVEFSPSDHELIDGYFRRTALPPSTKTFTDRMTLIKEDITRLNVDAIVNPANSEGLGCFVPEHKCLDNLIHRRAGPRLRQACRELLRGNKLEVGKPMVTEGFHLPCKYVLHIVGPIYKGRFDSSALSRCYTNALETANYLGLQTLAFCCISTGLYGYPIEESAVCALKAVRAWYTCNPTSKLKAIFCTYDDANYKAYKTLFQL